MRKQGIYACGVCLGLLLAVPVAAQGGARAEFLSAGLAAGV